MSNVVIYRVYGCPIEELNEEELEALIPERDSPYQIGFHCQYDQSRDFYWWGAADWSGNRGFEDWPRDVRDTLKGEIYHSWLKLSDEMREKIGPPKVMVLVVYD